MTGAERVLDVGCGTGTTACRLATAYGVTVVGITTSPVGVDLARERAASAGVSDLATFEVRDGTDNGFPDASFDRTWVLESSHLMRRRDRLVAECARVLCPGGRLMLCDIVLRRPLSLLEVRELREPLGLLRRVFGDARMEPLSVYASLAEDNGLVVDEALDLTDATRPTFDRWRHNADVHAARVTELLGADGLAEFREAADVLDGFWGDGTLGYGLLAAHRPA